MANSKKHKRKGLYGTLLFHALLLLSFMFMGLTYTIPPPPEEGITINFGFDDFGGGAIQPEEVVEELKEKEAIVLVHDPLYSDEEIENLGFTPFHLGGKCDAVILQADHSSYKHLKPKDFDGLLAVVDGRGCRHSGCSRDEGGGSRCERGACSSC